MYTSPHTPNPDATPDDPSSPYSPDSGAYADSETVATTRPRVPPFPQTTGTKAQSSTHARTRTHTHSSADETTSVRVIIWDFDETDGEVNYVRVAVDHTQAHLLQKAAARGPLLLSPAK